MTFVDTISGTLQPGFGDPVFDAQAGYRAALDALAYPGRVHEIGVSLDAPAPLTAANAALALTLCDFDTPVWLDAAAGTQAATGWLRFHAGVPIVGMAEDAQFAFIADAAAFPGFEIFAIGEDRYPDRSATLIIAVPSLTDGPKTIWTGPGIKDSIEVAIAGLPQDFWERWADNNALYPLGVDVIFTSGSGLVGLPRSVNVAEG